MANGGGAGQAIDLAARVGEIGFADFTSDLVTNIFNALIDANVQQTQQYIGLVSALSASLADYVNATHDDIGAEDIATFLGLLGIDLDAGIANAAERDAVNDAVEVPPPAGVNGGDNRVADVGNSQALKDSIAEAVARRLAANRYDFLKEMVQLGVLRVVVDHGTVETRLTFRTRGLTERGASESTRTTTTVHVGYAGVLLSEGGSGVAGAGGTGFFGGVAAGGLYGAANTLAVKSANKFNRDVTGSDVQIYGKVELHFKTDYQPLTHS